MIITHEVSMNLMKRKAPVIIDAVQDDKYTRNLAVSLYAGNEIWKPPDGTEILIRYLKSDGHGGEYSVLPDGSAAYSISGNVITAALAPQVLTAPGGTQVDLILRSAQNEISTFHILINVHPSVGAQLTSSEDYRYVSGYLPMPSAAASGHFIRAAEVNKNGVVTDTEAVDMEAYLAGYSFLPDVTTEDTGKVLQVSDSGKWTASAFTAIVVLTQAEYDALVANGTVQKTTLYVIVG